MVNPAFLVPAFAVASCNAPPDKDVIPDFTIETKPEPKEIPSGECEAKIGVKVESGTLHVYNLSCSYMSWVTNWYYVLDLTTDEISFKTTSRSMGPSSGKTVLTFNNKPEKYLAILKIMKEQVESLKGHYTKKYLNRVISHLSSLEKKYKKEFAIADRNLDGEIDNLELRNYLLRIIDNAPSASIDHSMDYETIVTITVDAGEYEDALTIARTIESPKAKLFSLKYIIDEMLEVGLIEEALAAIPDLLETLLLRDDNLSSDEKRDDYLHGIIYRLTKLGFFDEAAELTQAIRYPCAKEQRYRSMLFFMAQYGQLNKLKAILKSDPGLTKGLLEAYDNAVSEQTRYHIRDALTEYGPPETLPFLIKMNNDGEEINFWAYAAQLDKKGLLDRNIFNELVGFIDKQKYDHEYEMLTYLASNRNNSILKRYAEQTTTAIEAQRKTRPVMVVSLEREILFLGGQEPQTKDTHAYDLTLRILKTPENAVSSTLYIIDPQGGYSKQICTAFGETECNVNEDSFTIYLYTGNKSVRAYIRYYDEDEKYFAKSNIFIIKNPDAN